MPRTEQVQICRSSEEMRGKLSVVFHGEEGIDAGGVSREWYQVRHSCAPAVCFDVAQWPTLQYRILSSPHVTFLIEVSADVACCSESDLTSTSERKTSIFTCS